VRRLAVAPVSLGNVLAGQQNFRPYLIFKLLIEGKRTPPRHTPLQLSGFL